VTGDGDAGAPGAYQAFTVRLPVELHAELRTYSFYSGRSMNELIIAALHRTRESRRAS
jgi:predicted HicB family RNase H-like nuclease